METKCWVKVPPYLGTPSERSSCTAYTWGPVWCFPSLSGSRRRRRWCSCSCTPRTGEKSPGQEEAPLLWVASHQPVLLVPSLLLPSRSWRRSPTCSWTCLSPSHWADRGCQRGQSMTEWLTWLHLTGLLSDCLLAASQSCRINVSKVRSRRKKPKQSPAYLRLNSREPDLITSEVVSEYWILNSANFTLFLAKYCYLFLLISSWISLALLNNCWSKFLKCQF